MAHVAILIGPPPAEKAKPEFETHSQSRSAVLGFELLKCLFALEDMQFCGLRRVTRSLGRVQ
jgi:hypothetical protein